MVQEVKSASEKKSNLLQCTDGDNFGTFAIHEELIDSIEVRAKAVKATADFKFYRLP